MWSLTWSWIYSLKITEVLGILGFIIALVNLFWKYQEMNHKKPKLTILSLHPPQDAFIKIIKGEFFIDKILEDHDRGITYINPEWKVNNDKLFFNFLITNNGGQPIQILDMFAWIKDVKKQRFYQFHLRHSVDFDKEDEKNNSYWGPYMDIIDIKPYTTLEKRYLLEIDNGTSASHSANKKSKNAYLEIQLGNGSLLRKWIFV